MLVASRRQRRRPWLLLAAAATVAVLTVNAAISDRSPGPSRKLAELSYLDKVRPQVQRSIEEGGEVADVRVRAAMLGRAGITKEMERVAHDAVEVEAAVLAMSPPRSLRVAHGLLVSTVAVRARAMSAIRDATAGALGAGSPDSAVAALTRAGADLITADRNYQMFLDALPPALRAQSSMPGSQWVPDPQHWGQAQVTGFVGTLRSSTSLAAVHDVSLLLVATDPGPIAADGQTAVLPAAEAVTVRLVVADVGNVAEHHVAVTARLAGDPGRSPEVVQTFLDLAPGERLATTLGTLHPRVGSVYTLTVRVEPVDGQTNTSDIEKSLLLEER